MLHPKIAAIAPIDSCWLIEEQAANRYLEQIALIDPATAAEKQTEVFAAAAKSIQSGERQYEVVNGVAVIALEGPMTKKPTSMSWLFGGASTILVRDAIRAANDDPDVQKILLVVDSPGGQSLGTEQLALDIAASGKDVTCLIDGTCASAAYWVASQCDEIIASAKTDYVGSIGTIMSLVDVSRLYENAGMRVHVISTGFHKGAGTRGTQLTAEQLTEFQRYIESINRHFVTGVAAGRGLTDDEAKSLATGQVWTAEDALGLGLIDGIASFEETLTRLGASAPTRGAASQPRNTTAQAPSATPVKEKPMKLTDRLKAYFRGNPEAAQEAGVTEAELNAAEPQTETRAETQPVVSSEIQAQIDALARDNEQRKAEIAEMQQSQAASHAAAFADQVIREKRAFPAEREKITALATQAIGADGVKFESGKLVEGANMKAVREAYASRPQHRLEVDDIPGADPTRPNAVDSGDVPADPAKQALYRNMTPLGRAAATLKEGNK